MEEVVVVSEPKAETSSKKTAKWRRLAVRFEDIVSNEDAVARLVAFAQHGNTTKVIIKGPPGVGKTSTIQCLAHILLGDNYKDAVLKLNASNERGIYVLRKKIKRFAQQKVTLTRGCHKIVILDEADNMTEGVQQALRCTIEIFGDTTRLALACNTSENIIPPIQPRHAMLRFANLSTA